MKTFFIFSFLILIITLILSGLSVYFSSNTIIFPVWYQYHPQEGFRIMDTEHEKNIMIYLGNPKDDLGINYENITFDSSEEGVKLRGWYIKPENMEEKKSKDIKGIIGVHGAGADRRELLRHLKNWIDNDYEVVLIDCRDHGLSDGFNRGISFGQREHQDIISTLNYVTDEYKWEKIAIYGTSQGGSSTILAAASLFKEFRESRKLDHNEELERQEEEDVDDDQFDLDEDLVLILENPFSNKRKLLNFAYNRILKSSSIGGKELGLPYKIMVNIANIIPDKLLNFVYDVTFQRMGFDISKPHEPIEFIQDIEAPMLLLHGKDDRLVDVNCSKDLYNKAKEYDRDIDLWLVEGGHHGALVNINEEEHKQKINDFLKKHFKD